MATLLHGTLKTSRRQQSGFGFWTCKINAHKIDEKWGEGGTGTGGVAEIKGLR